MFIRRSKCEVEKLIAKQRIETLEQIICPGGHDYKKVGIKTVAHDTLFGNDLQEDVYVCSRCRKVTYARTGVGMARDKKRGNL